ncbi:MAG: sensor histidine kinase, partial [Candidatus Dadabacteria bacterium]
MQVLDSFRGRLILLTSGALLVPAVLFAFIAYSHSSTALKRVIGRHFASEARNVAHAVAMNVVSALEMLRRTARQDLMRDLRVGDVDKRVSALLAGLANNTQSCAELLVVDAQGHIVSASRPVRIATTLPPTAAIRSALAGHDGLTPPVADTGGRSPFLTLAVAIPDPDRPNHVLGALVGRFDWNELTQPLVTARRTLVEHGVVIQAAIINDKGSVVRTVPEHASAFARAERVNSENWQRLDRGDGSDGTPELVLGDKAFVVGHAVLPIARLRDWRVLVAQEATEALAPVRSMSRSFLLAFLPTLSVALLLALIEARRVTRPLTNLTQAIANFSADDSMRTPVVVDGYSELRVLAQTFNQMSSDLRRAQRALVEAAKFAFVGELAAGVAHEIRTPLGVLKSSAQLLRQSYAGTTEGDVDELVEIIGNEIDRVDRVLGDLTNLARPRSMQLEAASLTSLVFRAADFAEAQAQQKGVRVRRERSARDPIVACDRELLYQV